MNDADRARYRAAAWLHPSRVKIGGLVLRPLSLGSLSIAEKMGMDFQGGGFRGDLEALAARYVWAHVEPLEDVLWGLLSGAWVKEVEAFEFSPWIPAHARALETYLAETMMGAEAAWVEIMPRKIEGAKAPDDPPAGILAPDSRAMILSACAGAMPGMGEAALLWETPLPRLLAYYHAAIWKCEGVWTVAERSPEEGEVAAAAQDWAALRASGGPAAGSAQAAVDGLALLARASALVDGIRKA